MRNELNQIIVQKYKSDYQNALLRADKSKILSELEKLTGLARKHLIKLLNNKKPIQGKGAKGRPRKYTPEVNKHIIELHVLMEHISPKRMKVAIPLWLPFYERHYGILPVEVRGRLLEISSSTIGRILKQHKGSIKGKSTTRVNHKLKSIIPLKRLDEKVTAPGTVQADTVAHCGGSLLGDFANSLTLTDIFTNWTENRVCWTKHSLGIKKQLIDIEKDWPIIMKHFDTDCGTEFLNYRIVRYFEKNGKRNRAVKMRRARPYKKNDQCYVEQRNNTHVRNIFGYDRIDDYTLIPLMNKIYREYWNPLHNYFLPSFKLKEKVRVGGKIKKKFEYPKTPAQRILDSHRYSGYMKKKVQHKLNTLDPIALKKDLEKELQNFYRLLDSTRRNTA